MFEVKYLSLPILHFWNVVSQHSYKVLWSYPDYLQIPYLSPFKCDIKYQIKKTLQTRSIIWSQVQQ